MQKYFMPTLSADQKAVNQDETNLRSRGSYPSFLGSSVQLFEDLRIENWFLD